MSQNDEKSESSFLEMSDEEIGNLIGPEAFLGSASKETSQEQVVETSKEETHEGVSDAAAENDTVKENTEEEEQEGSEEDQEGDATSSDVNQTDEEFEKSGEQQEASKTPAEGSEGDQKPQDNPAKAGDASKALETASKSVDQDTEKTTSTESSEAPVNYEEVYKKIMAPFKANGREIQMKDPDEVVRLMQMGANYHQKMRSMKPHLKMIRMLENNNLLDENRLSYLIDIDKKNPEAIQKLVKDAGLDPMDMDTSKDSGYKQGNYSVSDAEMTFTQTLADVRSTPGGQEVIGSIHRNWDEQSKQALWADPNIMSVMAEHKSEGIYDKITSEIERQQTLGNLVNVPFLAAYHQVGEFLKSQGALVQTPAPGTSGEVSETAQQPQTVKRHLETRTGQTRSAVSENDRARAAASTRSKPKPAPRKQINFLEMSDEDFEKADFGRNL